MHNAPDGLVQHAKRCLGLFALAPLGVTLLVQQVVGPERAAREFFLNVGGQQHGNEDEESGLQEPAQVAGQTIKGERPNPGEQHPDLHRRRPPERHAERGQRDHQDAR